MNAAAQRSEQTIAVLSQAYVDAEFTHSEWAAAFAQDPQSVRNKLIPVRVRDAALDGMNRAGIN